jgi:hypothetical protein
MSAGEMDDGSRDMLIEVQLAPDADPADAERLGRQLRGELLRLEVETIAPVASAVAPPETKAMAGALDWGSLLVTLSGAGGVFTSVIALARGWLTRHSAAQSIKITIDHDTIELGRASAQEREDLVAAWIRRHSSE